MTVRKPHLSKDGKAASRNERRLELTSVRLPVKRLTAGPNRLTQCVSKVLAGTESPTGQG